METITIINNSGKIISTGKQLFGVFKDAKGAYQQKKAAIRGDREILKRSQTFAASRGLGGNIGGAPAFSQPFPQPADLYHQQPPPPPLSQHHRGQVYDDYVEYIDDGRSRASHRSHRTSRTRRSHSQSSRRSRPALTETNLRAASVVSGASATPRGAGRETAYHSPYAETAPRDMALSRPTLHHYTTAPTCTESLADSATIRGIPAPAPGTLARAQTYHDMGAVAAIPRRAGSDPSLRGALGLGPKKPKEIDMNLAYGNIPPDLASRHDLDPAYREANKEQRARGLVRHVEGMLDEAECVGSSAGAIIKRLQADPNAAAAVALSLAELSKIVGTMSPAFLGVLKGGSPAVFALLASPQFLIAAGVTVGMTVVMFGGWKIVKRIRAERAEQAQIMGQAMAFEAVQAAPQHWPAEGSVSSTMLNGEAAEYYTDGQAGGGRRHGGGAGGQHPGGPRGPAGPPGSRNGGGSQGSFDEALVLEEELSTIESWRRGIASYGEDESVDLELISPEAQKAVRKHRREERSRAGVQHDAEDDDNDDARTERSARTHRSSRSHRTSKTSHTHRSSRSRRERERGDDDDGLPEIRPEDSASSVGSHRSHRSHRSSRSSKRPERVDVLAIEDGRSEGGALDPGLEYVLRPKKDNMLKSLFKKKDKERGGSERASALVF